MCNMTKVLLGPSFISSLAVFLIVMMGANYIQRRSTMLKGAAKPAILVIYGLGIGRALYDVVRIWRGTPGITREDTIGALVVDIFSLMSWVTAMLFLIVLWRRPEGSRQTITKVFVDSATYPGLRAPLRDDDTNSKDDHEEGGDDAGPARETAEGVEVVDGDASKIETDRHEK